MHTENSIVISGVACGAVHLQIRMFNKFQLNIHRHGNKRLAIHSVDAAVAAWRRVFWFVTTTARVNCRCVIGNGVNARVRAVSVTPIRSEDDGRSQCRGHPMPAHMIHDTSVCYMCVVIQVSKWHTITYRVKVRSNATFFCSMLTVRSLPGCMQR